MEIENPSIVIDQTAIIMGSISVIVFLLLFLGSIIYWYGRTILSVYKSDKTDLKDHMDSCQARLHEDINKIDEYGKLNRALSYEAKDGIAKHVEKFHSK